MKREQRMIRDSFIREYELWLYQNEKSVGTIAKYQYCLKQFQQFVKGKTVSKDLVILWKEYLKKKMAPSTVNGVLAALNGFFRYKGWTDCIVKFLKIGHRVFSLKQKELKKEEYQRLVLAAEQNGNERMALLIQTVCATGIRISELPFITAEAVKLGYAEVDCKGRVRTVFLPGGLCRLLEAYAEKNKIRAGKIFVTRTGKAMDRSNIWREMKKLAKLAGVGWEKVFPHNLRHLFARSFYSQEKDLLRLADILGHSSINTTRIYTMESGEQHVRQLEQMDLLVSDYNRISLLL